MVELKVTDTVLSVCDMRPGFTKDECKIQLNPGTYTLNLVQLESEQKQGFSFVLKGTSHDGSTNIGSIFLDGARIGVYQTDLFHKLFKNDFEALYEWSSEKADIEADWADISHPIAGLAFFVSTGSDCEVRIDLLSENGAPVGLKAIPMAQPKISAEKSWSWITLKFKSSSQEIHLCHDRSYKIEIEDVLYDLVIELATINNEDTIEFLDTEDIDVSLPISTLRKDLGALECIEVFYQSSNSPDGKWKPIAPNVRLADFSTDLCVSEFAKKIKAVFIESNNLS